MPTQQPSLYEHLFLLTTIMKQKIVERFSGDALDERWRKGASTGSHDGFMDDVIDGGYFIKSQDSLASALAFIDFNNIRQYNFQDSIVIGVTKARASSLLLMGFHNNLFSNSVRLQFSASSSFMFIRSHDGTTSSDTNTDLVPDTNEHLGKIETSSANAKLTIDGVLKATHTTNLPNAKMQPLVGGGADTTGIDRGTNVRYLEAFNT